MYYRNKVEAAGSAILAQRLLANGFHIARPLYDEGIDLIAFQEKPFKAWPIQMKAATNESVSLDKKYDGRGLYMAYVLNALGKEPIIFILSYQEAFQHIVASHQSTTSWSKKGLWRSPSLGRNLKRALQPYSDPNNWFKN